MDGLILLDLSAGSRQFGLLHVHDQCRSRAWQLLLVLMLLLIARLIVAIVVFARIH
jgi:hypothetical protein